MKSKHIRISNLQQQIDGAKQLGQLKLEIADLNQSLAIYQSLEPAQSVNAARLKRLESSMDAMVAEKDADWQLQFEESRNQFKQSEHALLRQNEHLKVEIQAMKDSNNPNELESSTELNNRVLKLTNERDLLSDEFDSLALKHRSLCRDFAQANQDLLDYTSGTPDAVKRFTPIKYRAELEILDLKRLRSEQAEKLDGLKVELREAFEDFETQKYAFQQDIRTRADRIVDLEKVVGSFSDYAIIKKELLIFKSVEDDQNDENDVPLERLLISKNKRLENEFTSLKVDYLEQTSKVKQLIADSQTLANENARKQELVKTMERDIWLLQKQQPQSSPISSGNVIQDLMLGSETLPNANSDSSSIVSILTSQRDRYRQRFEEIQSSSRQQAECIYKQSVEIQNTKNDNVKLYEKLRYVESKGVDNSSRTSFHSDVTEKYRATYEDSIDPFRKFHIDVLLV